MIYFVHDSFQQKDPATQGTVLSLQAQDLNLISILLDHLDENKEPDADNACKFWICYFLAVLCSNNSTCTTAVHRAGGEMVEAKLHLLSQLDWSAWPANYATALSSLL